ncbi:hypothetical protein FHG87_004848 [Trinorchestia longiramus]|nr:hypothetical protein FHG87_004848 [Trinorchestia longiramus]
MQKQYKNLIISRSKEKLVCLFMTDNFSECSLSVIFENKSPLTLSAFKNGISVPLFKILHPNNGLRSYTQSDETVCLAMNYLRDFLVLPYKCKLQYIISSIDKDQVLREPFDKVWKLQQKNVFLLVDEVQIRPTVSISSGLLSGMAENNRDCKATSILITRQKLAEECSPSDLCQEGQNVSMVLGVHGGYAKILCFLCLWDSRADKQHYMQCDWLARSGPTPGSHNVVAHALMNPQNIFLPLLYIKFGLFKNFVKALDKKAWLSIF